MFTKEDRAYIKALKKLIDEATFPLKKREVVAFSHVVNWLDDLENRMHEQEEKPKASASKKKTSKKSASEAK